MNVANNSLMLTPSTPLQVGIASLLGSPLAGLALTSINLFLLGASSGVWFVVLVNWVLFIVTVLLLGSMPFFLVLLLCFSVGVCLIAVNSFSINSFDSSRRASWAWIIVVCFFSNVALFLLLVFSGS